MLEDIEIAAQRAIVYLPCRGSGYEAIERATGRTVGFVSRSEGRGRAYWDFHSPYGRFILTGPTRRETTEFGIRCQRV